MQVILFTVHGNYFALPADSVHEVRSPVPVTPLPFVPHYVDGIVGVGDRVMAQVDLARRLNLAPRAEDKESELLVIQSKNASYAMIIDRALMMTSVHEEDFHQFNTRLPAADTDPESADLAALEALTADEEMIVGEFKWEGNTVILLRAEALGIEGLEAMGVVDHGQALLGAVEQDEVEDSHVDDQIACLLVKVGKETYALPLDSVREVHDEAELTSLPNAPHEVTGISVLRGYPHLVLNLGTLFNQYLEGERLPLVVVAVRDTDFVMQVQRIIGIGRFSSDQRNAVADGRKELSCYLIGKDGGVTGLIDPEELVDEHRHEYYRRFLPKSQNQRDNVVKIEEMRRVLTFNVGKEICAIDVDSVERVAEFEKPESLPEEGRDTIAGVVEIGGEVLPVADLRLMMGSGEVKTTSLTAYVVIKNIRGNWALIVDRLNRLIDIPVSAIKPAGSSAHYMVSEIGRVDGNLLSILNLRAIEGTAGVDETDAAALEYGG